MLYNKPPQNLVTKQYIPLLTNVKVSGCFCLCGPVWANFSCTHSHLSGQLEACLGLDGLEWPYSHVWKLAWYQSGVTTVARPRVTHHPGACSHSNDCSIPQGSQKDKPWVQASSWLVQVAFCVTCVTVPLVKRSHCQAQSHWGCEQREAQLQQPPDFDALIIYHPSL